MNTDTSNPFNSSGPTTLEHVVNGLQRVVKSPPIKNGDTSTYHIFIHDKEITLSTAQLAKGSGRFTTLYYDAFGKMIFLQKEDWPKFAEYIAEVAEEGDIEETAAVMAADNTFEEICYSFDVTDDKEMLRERDQCKNLCLHNPHDKPYLVVPSAAVTSLIREGGIGASVEDVSSAMTARGYKRAKTHDVWLKGGGVRCWWFLPEAMTSHGVDLSNLGVEL
jgi:hypothetical protein